MAEFKLDAEELRPLVTEIVTQVFSTLGPNDDRIAYDEPSAAAMVSLSPNQLRDERLRGRIEASKGPRGKALYSRENLLAYLSRSK